MFMRHTTLSFSRFQLHFLIGDIETFAQAMATIHQVVMQFELIISYRIFMTINISYIDMLWFRWLGDRVYYIPIAERIINK